MKNNTYQRCLLTVLTILLTACQKEIQHDFPKTTNCKVVQVNYYDASGNTTPIDSAVYTYAGSNVSKVQLSQLYYTFEYNGNTITKRNIYIYGNATPDYYDTVLYNANGSINKIERFINAGTTYNIFYRYEFMYASGKLSQLNYYNMANNTATKEADYVFTYTGNNITTAVYNDYTGTTQPSPLNLNYTYDDNANYFKKQNSNILLIDYLFIDIDAKFFPLVFSANNVTNADLGNFSYALDADQNLKDVMLQNNLLAHYKYTCQ